MNLIFYYNQTSLRKIFVVFSIALVFVLLGCSETKKQIAAFELTVNEGFENPLGFYSAEPTFSWKLPSGIRSQKAYRIVVATSPEALPNSPDLWDSDRVESNESIFIPYQGKGLSSRNKVFWQVRFWDENENSSSWSEVAQMELGLLSSSDWKAQWVGLNTRKDSLKGTNNTIIHRPQLLRKTFTLKPDFVQARLYVSAKGVFNGFLNGMKVSEDVMSPGWTPYEQRIESLTYDITDLVQQGENALGFQLASGWYFGRMLWNNMKWGKEGSPQLICQLEVVYPDGTVETIVTDESWKGTTNGPIRFAELYDGETYDANYELPGWNTITFKPNSWEPVSVLALDDNVNISPKRHRSVKAIMELPSKKIIPADGSSSIIFDLEQNMVGVPRIKVPMKKGDTLRIRFSEMLAPDGGFYTDNYRSAKSTDYYVASKDGPIDWTPTFTFHGFQFVELSGFDDKKIPDLNWVTGIVQHSDFDVNGTFKTSHDKINRLQNNITWGLRGNFFDIPTDCPQRDERLGWTGDAQVFSPTSMFNADVHSFWTSWLQTLRESQFENGGIPFVAPDVLENNVVSSGWGDAAVIIPWDIYIRTGDKSVLEENYEMMKAWVAHHQSQTENFISNMNSFGDWLQPFQDEKSRNRGDTSKRLIGTAFFAHSANLTSKVAEVLGFDKERQHYQKLFQKVAAAFQNEFIAEDGSIINSEATQTGYLLALNFGLLSKEKEPLAKSHLLAKIKEADNHLRTGFLGTPLLPKVLDEMGEIDLMYTILLNESYPSWFYSINQGATTIWERWNSYSKEEGYNPQPMNSLNHYAYGAIGQWMYERIGGIEPLEPGYKMIRIAPMPGGGLTTAKTSYDSPYGLISSSWNIKDEIFTMDITIPTNTTALVLVPNPKGESIKVNGLDVEKIESVEYMEYMDGITSLTIQPGNYSIQVEHY